MAETTSDALAPGATDQAETSKSAAGIGAAAAEAASSTDRTRRALAALEAMYASLAPSSIGELRRLYAEDAWFKDPFNEVRGGAAIVRIFAHMFQQLDSPRFLVLERAVDGDRAWLIWNLEYRLRAGQPVRTIHGASHLRFSADGRVTFHRDYWDTSEELYESMPLLGSVLRLIRRRLRAT